MCTIRLLIACCVIVVLGALAAGAASPAMVAAETPEGIGDAGVTGITVANLDLVQSSVVTLDFLWQGRDKSVWFEVGPVAPGGIEGVRVPGEPSLYRGDYAVAAGSDRALGLTAITNWEYTGGQVVVGGARLGREVIVPLATKGYRGHTSVVAIQNTDLDTPATVSVELIATGKTVPVVDATYPIDPGRSIILDLAGGDFADVSRGAVGLMRVTSAMPVAVQVFGDVESRLGVYGFEGEPADRATGNLLAPLVHAGWQAERRFPWDHEDAARDSWLAVANAGAHAADVTVTYRGVEGPCAGATVVHGGGPRSVAGGSMVLLHAGAVGSGLPEGCRATATVTAAGGRLVGVVVDVDADGRAGAYNMVPVDMVPVPTPTPTPGPVPVPGPAPIHLPHLSNQPAESWAALLASGGPSAGPSGPAQVRAAHRSRAPAIPAARAQAEPVPRAVSTLFRRNLHNMSTGLAVMNAGTAPAEVRLRLFHSTGQMQVCAGCFATVEPGAAHHFWFGELDDVEPGTYGHLWVEGTEPLAVVSYDFPLYGAAYDMLMFNGLPVPGQGGVVGTNEGWVPLALE